MDVAKELSRTDHGTAVALPEFRVPIERAVPGMVLSRNLEHRGQMLLRHNSTLDSALIERLREQQVDYIYIHFSDQDVEFYKRLVLNHDNPPTYEGMGRMLRDAFWELVPSFARPEYCTREASVARIVEETIHHTIDLLFSSQRCFELLRQTRFFQARPVRHCPTAWVYSLCIGAGLGYNVPHLLDLGIAALFYDVGMLRVNPRVLAKPGRLTEAEWGEVRKHSYFGRRILEEVNSFSSTAAIVAFEHHENYYGGGYPKNKRGSSIHEFSQIVSLADKFAALVTARDYRQRFQPYQAYEMLLAQTKSSVSPRIFVAFLKHVLLYPRGSMLRLSTGEIAEPVSFPLHLPTRPTVMITHGPEGHSVVGAPRMIHLVEHPQIGIESFAIVEEQQRWSQAEPEPLRLERI
ncbi:HD domain-containing protein [bacterium]|nr:HD domain-containing protein [bacterium]